MAAVIEWEPAVPDHFNQQEAKEYRAGRDAAILELCVQLGVSRQEIGQ